MFKKVMRTLLVPSMMAISISSYAAAQSFDEVITAIEAKLPVLEKQAKLVTKMLNKDKHQLRLQADIDKFVDGKPESAENTYLYRVFQKKEASFEQSAIKASLLLEHASSITRIQPLHPGLLFNVCLGVDSHQGKKGFISVNKDFFKDAAKTEKLISLCNRLLEIQQPVQEAAKTKLNVGEKNFRVKTVDTDDIPKNVYAFLLPVKIHLGMS